jgi:arsenate reductase (thioredoxin)
MKKRVLFLCTGNSCRSQMAEAIVNARIGESWEAFSAGIKPAGFVHPKALAVLEEINIHHNGYSKPVDTFQNMKFDLVITVCDSAAEECPVWLGQGRRLHIGFPDPAQIQGSELEIKSAFRSIRDNIIKQIIPLLQEYNS